MVRNMESIHEIKSNIGGKSNQVVDTVRKITISKQWRCFYPNVRMAGNNMEEPGTMKQGVKLGMLELTEIME